MSEGLTEQATNFWESAGDWLIHFVTCIIDAFTKGTP